MGKTSRRLFPLGGRRKQPQDEPVSHALPTQEPHLPLSKAERILGTTGLSVIPRNQQSPPFTHDTYGVQPPVSRSGRTNHPSNRDSDASAVTTFDQYLFSAAKQTSPNPDHYPEQQYYNTAATYEDRSFTPSTFNTQRRLLHHASSTTLRSSYTSRTLPSYISQRSTESSYNYQSRASDFVPPLESRTPEVYIPRSAQDYAPMAFGSGQPLQRKPTRKAIGNIFSKPSPPIPQQEDPVERAVNSPSSSYSASFSGSQGRVYSPEEMVAHSQELSRSYHDTLRPPRPRTATSSAGYNRKPLPLSEQQQEFNRVKEHIRRPMPGAKHWFDSFPDLDEEDEDFTESDEEPAAPVQVDFGPGPIQDGYPTPDSNNYSDAGSVKRQSSGDLRVDEYVPAEPQNDTSPTAQRQSPQQSLHDIVERPESRDMPKETAESSPEPQSDPVTDAETDSYRQSPRASAYTRASVTSSVVAGSEAGEQVDNGSHLALPHIRDSIAVSEVDGHVHHAKTLSYDIKVRTKAPTPELSRDRSSRSSSVRSGRTTLSMPAMRSPPASPAYLTIPSQYTRKTAIVKEKTIPRRARSNTQGAQSAGSQSNPSENGDIAAPPKQRMIAVTEEEEALLELMRRKRKALANHGLQKSLQPKYATSVKRPSTSHGTAAPKIREQWATARSPSVRSTTKLRPSISPSLLDSFPASPTFRQPLLSPSAANLPSPPPSAALPSLPPLSPVPPVPPIPRIAAIERSIPGDAKTLGGSLYARRSLSKRTLKASSAVMSIDSRLAVASRRPDTIPIPSSVPTPRLSPLTLDTIRLTRPAQSQTNSIISSQSPPEFLQQAETARSPDSPLSSSPPTPRSQSLGSEVVIKDSNSLRDSGSTVDPANDHTIEVVTESFKDVDAPTLTPGVPSPVSPLSNLHSPISPLTPSMSRLSLVSALTRRSFAPSSMHRQSGMTMRTDPYDDYPPVPEIIASDLQDENTATYMPRVHQQTLEITQLRSDFLDNAPLTAPIVGSKSHFALDVPPMPPVRRLPKNLSINVAKANSMDLLIRRHSIGSDKRESVALKRVSVVTTSTPQRNSPQSSKAQDQSLQLQQRQQQQQDMEQVKRLSVAQRRYSGYTPRESFRASRYSINEDVLGAWTELGGWNSIARLA